MKRIGKSAALIVMLAVAAGCVQTQPLMSHAHIGHALTNWHDTPDQQGLYTVAAKELDFAIDAASQAIASTTDPRRANKHVDNALHALNPDLQRFGKGLDYGAIRAMMGAIEHLEYAANSPDASDNFVASVVSLADQGDLVVLRMLKAQELLTTLEDADPASDPRLRQAHELLMAAKIGAPNSERFSDSGSGQFGSSMARGDHGLVHISAQLNDMLRRETDPAYEPVSRRYVLGLVKLPSGRWGYRISNPAYTSGGYGY